MTNEEAMFGVWWSMYRTTRWRSIRPDMGPDPSPGYLEGLKDTVWLGWQARANLHISTVRGASQTGDKP